MEMRKVYCIGETVYDIIFRDQIPFYGCPGGSMLNTAVSLGRCGIETYLLTEYGNDLTGNIIDNFLNNNNVKTDFIYKYDDGQTPIALAFLDENEHPAYNFMKNYPVNRLQFDSPVFTSNDILLFGSFHSLLEEVREKIIGLVNNARNAGAIIIYDPNFRKSYYAKLTFLKDLIHENMKLASITKGSDEDFKYIFNVDSAKSVFELTNKTIEFLIYTKGKDGVQLISKEIIAEYNPEQIKVISTIGAGDSFSAGLIYSLILRNIYQNNLSEIDNNIWENILSIASEFASNVCQSMDNYISMDFAKIKSLNLSQMLF